MDFNLTTAWQSNYCCYPLCQSVFSRTEPRGWTCIDIFIVGNWLARLWRLHMHSLQGESTTWRPRGPTGVVTIQRSAGLRLRESSCFSSILKAGKSQYFRSKAIRQEEFLLTNSRVNFSVPLKLSTDWMWPIHIREGDLFYSDLPRESSPSYASTRFGYWRVNAWQGGGPPGANVWLAGAWATLVIKYANFSPGSPTHPLHWFEYQMA